MADQELQEKIRKLEEKLSVYEKEDEGVGQDEERRQAYSLFKTFDADNSNDLDPQEFQLLAFELGETLTEEEVQECFKTLDTDKSGTVDFEEFFKWWTSSDRQVLLESRSSDKSKHVKALHAKLTSRSYMRTVSKLIEKAHQHAVRKADKNSGVIHVAMTVGELKPEEEKSKIDFTITKNTETAQSLRKTAGCDAGDVLVSVGFSLADGLDDFELGEYVGAVKSVISMAKKELGYHTLTAKLEKIGDKKVLALHISFKEDNEHTQMAFGTLETFDLKSWKVHIGANSSASEPDVDPTNAKLNLDVDISFNRQSTIPGLMNIISAGSPSAAGLAPFMMMLTQMKKLDVSLEFDTFAELLEKAMAGYVPSGQAMTGWGSLKPSLLPLLAVLGTDDIPEALSNTYYSTLKNISGVHHIKAVGGFGSVLSMDFHGYEITRLLPTEQDIKDFRAKAEAEKAAIVSDPFGGISLRGSATIEVSVTSSESAPSDAPKDDFGSDGGLGDEIHVKCHAHIMKRDHRDNGWACDGRNQAGACRQGCTGFYQTSGWSRWRCYDCDFDLCLGCAKAWVIPADVTRDPSKNLIINPCGTNGLDGWTIESNGGDGWKVEDEGGCPDNPDAKCFATSYGQCSASQTIDLVAAGLSAETLDAQPAIIVSEWFGSRNDCGSTYWIDVTLLDAGKSTIDSWNFTETTAQWAGGSWKAATHSFTGYGPGVRFIKFTHNGKDTQFWAGHYGARMTRASVLIAGKGGEILDAKPVSAEDEFWSKLKAENPKLFTVLHDVATPGSTWNGEVDFFGMHGPYKLKLESRNDRTVSGLHTAFYQTEGVVLSFDVGDDGVVKVKYSDNETAFDAVLDVESNTIKGTCNQKSGGYSPGTITLTKEIKA